MKRIVVGSFIIALVAALVVPGTPLAQDKYPSKPITGIVPASAGGSTDLMARAIEKVWPKYALPAAGCRSTSPGAPGLWQRSLSSGPSPMATRCTSATARGTTLSCRTSRRCPTTLTRI